MSTPLMSVFVAAAAITMTVVLGLVSSVGIGVKLLAGTLVLIGGNDNPTSFGMSQQLGGNPLPPGHHAPSYLPVGVLGQGYLDPTNPASPFYGYDPISVQWPSVIPFTFGGHPSQTYASSEAAGLKAMQAAIVSGLGAGGAVQVVGYSSSANIVVQELKELKAAGSPNTDDLQFTMIAPMNRPNGGIAERFPGVFVPFINVPLNGSPQTKTAYKVTDISWQYDPISDFPNYPLDLISDLNSLIAFFTQHGDYYYADVSANAPRVRPDSTVGNITYVTLAAPLLPLLVPFKSLGVPQPLLKLVEPVLKVLVDFGYNRRISPGTPTPASLAPSLDRWIALPFQLIHAVGVGIADAFDPKRGKSVKSTTPTGPAISSAAVEPQAAVSSAAVSSASDRRRPATDPSDAGSTARPHDRTGTRGPGTRTTAASASHQGPARGHRASVGRHH